MKKEASLSIVEDVEQHKFLMIKHLRGINEGCVNFPGGGKRENGETMTACVVRETFEETGIKIENPVQVGYIEFPTKDFYVYVFKSTVFSGKIHENKDEVHAFWLNEDEIPYEQMREADRDFLPDILSGKFVRRRYLYDENFHLQGIQDLSPTGKTE